MTGPKTPLARLMGCFRYGRDADSLDKVDARHSSGKYSDAEWNAALDGATYWEHADAYREALKEALSSEKTESEAVAHAAETVQASTEGRGVSGVQVAHASLGTPSSVTLPAGNVVEGETLVTYFVNSSELLQIVTDGQAAQCPSCWYPERHRIYELSKEGEVGNLLQDGCPSCEKSRIAEGSPNSPHGTTPGDGHSQEKRLSDVAP